jgi:hypothetical protein
LDLRIPQGTADLEELFRQTPLPWSWVTHSPLNSRCDKPVAN